MELTFWLSLAAIVYAYAGYPLVLIVLARLTGRKQAVATDAEFFPTVSMIIPVHNESDVLRRKIENCFDLDYPRDKLAFVIVSDGSTDDTPDIARGYGASRNVIVVELSSRRGKAVALNSGLARATGEVVVFSDASIMLERDALRAITIPFADPAIGCVSGEDYIGDGSGEGLYGRYELMLRNLESRVGSIVGASGSFYAERRELCATFIEGMAPDFLSVLHTVEQGYRAITAPSARGSMTSVRRTQDEFQRKVRTLIRGMTAMFARVRLLNPLRFGLFAFELWSHKLTRWLVPVFLLLAFVTNAMLVGQPFYLAVFVAQVSFYLVALLALNFPKVEAMLIARIPAYFAVANAAIGVAWIKYLSGTRLEVWSPSKRSP